MAEAAVSNQQTADPKGSASKQKREQSSIDFPYASLDDGIAVAKAVHKLGGNQCRLDSLAAELGHDTVNSGGFRQKLSTAHTFGFTSLSQGIVSLKPLGVRVIDTDQEKAGRLEAFLNVPLYNSIYEQFKNGPLPPPQGLEAAMVSLGVVRKQAQRARQAFQNSAKQAGFFAYGASKLVYPALGAQTVVSKLKDDEPPADEGKPKDSNGGNGGDGHHPLIDGLIRALPKPGPWTLDARRKWLQAAAMNFDYVYTDESSEGKMIKVSVESDKTSAS